MSPRPQIDHIRKPQILTAAAEVIAERGVASTRIADVAERAGTSSGAILYWFGSKDELLAEALTGDEEHFYGELSTRLSGLGQPRDQLRMLIEACVADPDWRLWMELWTRALRDRGALAARQRFDRRWRDQIADVIKAGRDAGEFADVDVDAAAATLASLLDGLAVQVTLGDVEIKADRMRDLALDAAEAMLRCELSPLQPAALGGDGSDGAGGDGS